MKNCKVIHNLKLVLSLLLFLLLASCNPNEVEVASIVQFEETLLEINDQTTFPIPVSLSITPASIVESEIVIGINASRGTTVETSPQADDLISLSLDAGQTTAAFEINSITTDEAEFVRVEFEIVDVGPGLLTDDLEGRFLNLDVQPPQENFLFQDDFSNCSAENIPLGWSEVVVSQNGEGSAAWNCTSVPSVEINAFVSGSSDQTASEVWLISPALDLTAVNSADLRFEADRRFEVVSPGLMPYGVQIATDFVTQGFENANWQPFEAGLDFIMSDDPGSDGFSQSDRLSLSAFSGETIHLAFIYRAGPAGTSDATILRIRNFELSGN